MNNFVVVRDDDPRAAELQRDGYCVVATSWGARLELGDGFDESAYRARVELARAAGYDIAELDSGWADALYRLESAAAGDYPVTPATPAPEVTPEGERALWADGWRIFGATNAGELVGVTIITQHDRRADTERTVVAAAHRGCGVAGALKAASILAVAAEGARTFMTLADADRIADGTGQAEAGPRRAQR